MLGCKETFLEIDHCHPFLVLSHPGSRTVTSGVGDFISFYFAASDQFCLVLILLENEEGNTGI